MRSTRDDATTHDSLSLSSSPSTGRLYGDDVWIATPRLESSGWSGHSGEVLAEIEKGAIPGWDGHGEGLWGLRVAGGFRAGQQMSMFRVDTARKVGDGSRPEPVQTDSRLVAGRNGLRELRRVRRNNVSRNDPVTEDAAPATSYHRGVAGLAEFVARRLLVRVAQRPLDMRSRLATNEVGRTVDLGRGRGRFDRRHGEWWISGSNDSVRGDSSISTGDLTSDRISRRAESAEVPAWPRRRRVASTVTGRASRGFGWSI